MVGLDQVGVRCDQLGSDLATSVVVSTRCLQGSTDVCRALSSSGLACPNLGLVQSSLGWSRQVRDSLRAMPGSGSSKFGALSAIFGRCSASSGLVETLPVGPALGGRRRLALECGAPAGEMYRRSARRSLCGASNEALQAPVRALEQRPWALVRGHCHISAVAGAWSPHETGPPSRGVAQDSAFIFSVPPLLGTNCLPSSCWPRLHSGARARAMAKQIDLCGPRFPRAFT